MTVPYLTVYTKNLTGADRGEYTKYHPQNAEIKFIQHSLSEGDRMVFTQWLDAHDSELDRKRPIRFYTDDNTKLFDGQVIDTKYVEIGNDHKVLEVTANGWWQELASMDFHQPVEYDETETPNSIFDDLVRLANNMGVIKEAIYEYDTDRIPGYNDHKAAYTTEIGTSFSFSNVYQGMQTMTRFMDVAENSSTYEFGLRIETLPRAAEGCDEAITVSNVSGNNPSIYILPFILNMDRTPVAYTYKKFQLASGYTVRRDYRRLANDVVAIGDGVVTQQIRTIEGQEDDTQILKWSNITSNDISFNPTNQPLGSHYLRVMMTNQSGVPVGGTVKIHFLEWDAEGGVYNDVEEAFYMDVSPSELSAPSSHVHYTSVRSCDMIDLAGIQVLNFGGWSPPLKISVDEVTNTKTPYNTTIAGASINDYGLHSHRIDELWLNTQARVDYAAGKHCRLYHAPMHVFDGEVVQRYIEYTNLIGRTADVYSPFVEGIEGFLITDVLYSFKGTKIEQRLKGYRHEYDWDYDDTNIYVIDLLDNQVITLTLEDVVV